MLFRPRVASDDLAARLRRSGAVLVEGAKGCGKTELATRAAASVVRVDTDPDVPAYMDVDPARVLDGATPRLIDEWQVQPRLWDFVRRAVDDRRAPGQFILTGSATPDDDARRHSGAGRFSVMRLRPMSLSEAGWSTGEVSWGELRRGGRVRAGSSGVDLDGLARMIVRGGWPATLDASHTDARDYVTDYLALLTQADLSRALGVRRDPVRVRQFLGSIARNVATDVSLSTIVADVGEAGGRLNRDTAAVYLDALNRLMIIEDQPAWATALKDSATLRKAPKRHFVDPSLAAAALGATEVTLVREPKTLGSLFESLVIRDLRVYAASEGGEVYHYRDSAGREIDAVVRYPDGWVACGIKLGTGSVDAAADALRRAVAQVATQTVGEAQALVVITGAGPGYRRPDGVDVVPITALRG